MLPLRIFISSPGDVGSDRPQNAEPERAGQYAQARQTNKRHSGVSGVRVRDRLSGDEAAVTAIAVIDATGPWSGEEGPFATGSSVRRSKIRPSRGTHVLVSRSRIPGSILARERTTESESSTNSPLML